MVKKEILDNFYSVHFCQQLGRVEGEQHCQLTEWLPETTHPVDRVGKIYSLEPEKALPVPIPFSL